jgi:hypothetical protein
MSSHHYAFGLRISSNNPIPGFAPGLQRAIADVEVTFGSLPFGLDPDPPSDQFAMYVSPWQSPNEDPCCRVWRTLDGELFRVIYGDGTDCAVDRCGRRIWIRWPDTHTLADVVPYLQGQLLGFAQRLQGITCLHASAIVIGDCAIAVTGPAGSGKSSTAAAFFRLGYPVLADDVVPVTEENGKFMVRAAHQRIWLRPDMVETLYGSTDALPTSTPFWDKRYLDLNAAGPAWPSEPKRLAAIYVLSPRANKPDRPAIKESAPRDTLLQLLCNTYLNHLLDAEMRATEFGLLTRMQQSLPVRLVLPHDDGARIQQLCRAILADFRSLSS